MPLTLTRSTLISLVLCCVTAALQAQSLTDVVRLALSQYPSLATAQARTDAARADIARARSAHYPQISVGAGLNSYASGSMPSSLGRSSFSPSARINLWSGGRIEADAERAQALTQASEA